MDTVPLIHANIRELLSVSDALLSILGHERSQRYLVMFQNNNELRPTGGFMGSYALLDIDRGEIKKIDIPGGGTYDVQGQLTEYVKPPRPMRVIADRWEFQDANYFPDFAASAEKIMWFYEEAGGPSVDGVIAINATFFEALLDIIGPIEMPEYGVIITSDNFFDTIQKQVEFEYDKEENKPKQIIADMAPIALNRLLQSGSQGILDVVSTLETGLQARELQFYFVQEKLQKIMAEKGWSGAIKQTNGDYLNVVSTNIAGGKTDAVTLRDYDLEVDISDDGSITNTLTITHTHDGDPNGVFTDIPNVDYLRVYVPDGSELLSVKGFNPPGDNLFEVVPEAQAYPEDDYLKKQRELSTVDVCNRHTHF